MREVHPEPPHDGGAELRELEGAAVAADPVNHPAHYTMGGIEVIDAIEAWDLGFHRGNAVKYIARAGRKRTTEGLLREKEIEDLRKARWYLDREIERLQRGGRGA